MPSAPPRHDPHTTDRVQRIVLQAMTGLLDAEAPERPLQSFVDRMLRAVLGSDPSALDVTVDVMRRAGVPGREIAEVYVPRVAEILGLGWSCDALDFAAVSIGAARLQAQLRRLDDIWAMAHPPRPGDCPAFLVGVPDGCQHTLGAAVLAGQLRHRGFAVHFDPALTAEALSRRAGSQRYAGIFLSASGAARLDSCAGLVASSRRANRDTPVIIGGTILQDHHDIPSLTGGDHATSDVVEALSLCGIRAERLFDKELAGAAG